MLLIHKNNTAYSRLLMINIYFYKIKNIIIQFTIFPIILIKKNYYASIETWKIFTAIFSVCLSTRKAYCWYQVQTGFSSFGHQLTSSLEFFSSLLIILESSWQFLISPASTAGAIYTRTFHKKAILEEFQRIPR